MEIEIRRSALWALLGAVLVSALLGLGYFASPRGDDGRPLLLLPDVRAVETYRHTAGRWAAEWRALDATLRDVLGSPDTALLPQSRAAQRAFEEAVEVARRVEGTESPPAMLGLRDQALTAAAAYVDASAAVNRWLSAPSVENYNSAKALYEQAEASLTAIESNQWLAGVDSEAAASQP